MKSADDCKVCACMKTRVGGGGRTIFRCEVSLKNGPWALHMAILPHPSNIMEIIFCHCIWVEFHHHPRDHQWPDIYTYIYIYAYIHMYIYIYIFNDVFKCRSQGLISASPCRIRCWRRKQARWSRRSLWRGPPPGKAGIGLETARSWKICSWWSWSWGSSWSACRHTRTPRTLPACSSAGSRPAAGSHCYNI